MKLLDKKVLRSSVMCFICHRHYDDVQAHNSKVRFDYDKIVMVV